MTLVIDASIALAWVFGDEQDSVSQSVLELVSDNGAIVPAIWRIEVANGLRSAMRRKRISQSDRTYALHELADLPINDDPDTNKYAWSTIVALSDQYDLTPYDASYLELVVRRNATLASNDKDLNQAAKAIGIRTLR
jgi:predicted nucleic acid-binding protein